MVYYDVQLAGIVIKGNTAIVHYFFKNEFKDNKGKIEKDNGRLTDILTKEKGKWKYLGWSESKPNYKSK
jgi:ketosteroid isomerase-like protein